MDWGIGRYARSAEQLPPAALVLPDAAAPAPREDPAAFRVTGADLIATASRDP